MRNWILKFFLLILLGLTLTSCAAQNERQMYAKASALTKLSSAVEATVLYKTPSSTLTDNELLKLSTTDDPGLLQEFNGFNLHVQKNMQGVVLLVCAGNENLALLEDASCTAKLDRHHWRDSATTMCQFTLTIAELCF
jgi:hypothetical protein